MQKIDCWNTFWFLMAAGYFRSAPQILAIMLSVFSNLSTTESVLTSRGVYTSPSLCVWRNICLRKSQNHLSHWPKSASIIQSNFGLCHTSETIPNTNRKGAGGFVYSSLVSIRTELNFNPPSRFSLKEKKKTMWERPHRYLTNEGVSVSCLA